MPPEEAAAGERRQRLVLRLLALVEASVGTGVAVPEAEWAALRTEAAGDPRKLALVERLRGVVVDCNREIEASGATGDDVLPLRAAIVEYVRRTVEGRPESEEP